MPAQPVTPEMVLSKLADMPPESLVEIYEFIDFIKHKPIMQTAAEPIQPRISVHPAYGIWADRANLGETAEFARHLRRNIEERTDGQLPG
jgi:hypothetical protein